MECEQGSPVLGSAPMKSNAIWVLVSGLAVGFLIGREFGARSGGSRPSDDAAQTTKTNAAAAPGEIPSTWLKAEEFGAADAMKDLTPAQKYLVLKVMNEKPCDCGCPHGSFAKCKKEDPGCPRAPVVLTKAVDLAKQGKSFDEIVAGTAKGTGGQAQQPPADQPQKAQIAAWSPIKGPKQAKVTIVEFSDFQCPFCSRVEPTISKVVETYGKDVRVVWRNQPLPFHEHAREAAEAAMAANAQGKFWPMHDKLFANQQALDRASLEKYAGELGLNVPKFKADMDAHKYKDQIDADSQHGTSIGANGTPAFFINGQSVSGAQPFESFKAVIDRELKHANDLLGKGTSMEKLYDTILSSLAAAPAPSAAPAPAEHVDIDPGDSPSKGPKNAPVTVLIFSDFQCPFCSRVEPTLKQLEGDYKGKIRFVWKNKPLPFHDKAHLAAEAAMAANEQGKFWEYHDTLFAHQDQLDRVGLEKHATDLGLNVEKFKAALDSGKFKSKVDEEVALGDKSGAGGTPTFFINGDKLVGAQPVDAFKKAIDGALAKKK